MTDRVEKGVVAGLVQSDNPEHQGYVELWSRDGFVGQNAVGLRAGYSSTFKSVSGPHKPWIFNLTDLPAPDEADPWAVPEPVLSARDGLVISLSKLARPMPFVMRNVDCDEVHFIQEGEALVESDWGDLEAGPGDFIFLPRSVGYRITPRGGTLTRLVIEHPENFAFDTPAPFGMIDFGRSVRRSAAPAGAGRQSARETTLLVKSQDGITRYDYDGDVLQLVKRLTPQSPVWALNIADINPMVYERVGGPPAHFLATPHNELLLYTLSARSTSGRPPIHYNADYEEMIFYVRGPGAWGAVDRPGTFTWIPKGISHHGPSEHVPEGYYAWMLEAKATPRITPFAERHARVMTGTYEPFEAPGPRTKAAE